MSSLNQFFPFNNDLVRRFITWKQDDEEPLWRQKAIEALSAKLKKQQNHQFSKLQLALDKKNRDTPCVLLPRSQDGRWQVLHKKMLPHVMSCRIFRWPDLQSHHELKPSPSCPYAYQRREGPETCVNPYHYDRDEEHVPAFPPVVIAREIKPSTNASSPPLSPQIPQSPLSPGSNYCTGPQYQGIPNYFSTITTPPNQIFSSQPHQQENPINYMRTTEQSYYPNQLPLSEPNSCYGSPSSTYGQQSPPPVYTRHDPQQTTLMPMDAMDDTQHTDTTFSSSDDGNEHWCRIEYAEKNNLFKEDFKGSSREVFVDGYTNPLVRTERFSLCRLSSVNRCPMIERIRSSIGRGISLENNDGQIFVTNLSENSIYFHSRNHNAATEGVLSPSAVVKVLPQQKVHLFNQKKFEEQVREALGSQNGKAYEKLLHLSKHCTIEISFVEGWGRGRTKDVSSMPCWIRILLLKPAKLVDQHMRTLKPSDNITSTS